MMYENPSGMAVLVLLLLSIGIILLRDVIIWFWLIKGSQYKKSEVMCKDFFSTSVCFLKEKERKKKTKPKQSVNTETYNSILYTEAQLVF